jgi:antirestriction protein ArdC
LVTEAAFSCCKPKPEGDETVTKGYACPLWLTFKQSIELGGHVRKGEAGELVVYANSITRTKTDGQGEETEREIPATPGGSRSG